MTLAAARLSRRRRRRAIATWRRAAEVFAADHWRTLRAEGAGDRRRLHDAFDTGAPAAAERATRTAALRERLIEAPPAEVAMRRAVGRWAARVRAGVAARTLVAKRLRRAFSALRQAAAREATSKNNAVAIDARYRATRGGGSDRWQSSLRCRRGPPPRGRASATKPWCAAALAAEVQHKLVCAPALRRWRKRKGVRRENGLQLLGAIAWWLRWRQARAVRRWAAGAVDRRAARMLELRGLQAALVVRTRRPFKEWVLGTAALSARRRVECALEIWSGPEALRAKRRRKRDAFAAFAEVQQEARRTTERRAIVAEAAAAVAPSILGRGRVRGVASPGVDHAIGGRLGALVTWRGAAAVRIAANAKADAARNGLRRHRRRVAFNSWSGAAAARRRLANELVNSRRLGPTGARRRALTAGGCGGRTRARVRRALLLRAAAAGSPTG